MPGDALLQPHVEVITRSAEGDQGPPARWYRSRRLGVFVVVFALVLLPGLAWDFLRPAQYRATASVLTEQPPVDQLGWIESGPDVQHVAIQGRLLLGPELLEEALRLAGEQTDLGVTAADDLAGMLDVTPVPDTNLVELSATGEDPDLLAPIVNSWVAAYLELRQIRLEREIGDTLDALREEHEALGTEIQSRTAALEQFRSENDIVTLERSGNEALARLESLQADLNRARDEAVEAEARLAASEAAIERGDPVVPSSEQGVLDELEARSAELRGKLIELEKRYLPMFLDNHPEHRVIPAQLEALEAQIEEKLAHGRRVVLVQGRREVEQARQRVSVLERELGQQKGTAGTFTTSFARYESMQAELTALEKMYQETGARVVELEAKGLEKYPPVEVIDAAHRPTRPFQPQYWRDALWVLVAAAVSALGAVWLTEYLTRRPRSREETAPVTGVRVYGGGQGATFTGHTPSPAITATVPQQTIPGPKPAILPGALPRELIPAEVGALWGLADPVSRQLMALLLSGLSLEECAALEAHQFNLAAGSVRTAGTRPREIRLAPAITALFTRSQPLPAWADSNHHRSPAELASRIALLAHDAGLTQPAEVTADTLRHSYIAFLVRQGARLTELEQLVGTMPPSELTRYASLSPAGQAKPLTDVETTYPSLKDPEQRASSVTG
jgi:uncharacterized protein involved in exopolysaccharide biosynthesis